MSSNDSESNRERVADLPKTRPLVRHPAEGSAVLLRPTASIPQLHRYASLAAHSIGCTQAWVEITPNSYAAFPTIPKSSADNSDVTLNDIKRSVFSSGVPDDLTILPEATIYCAAGESNLPVILFVVACPIFNAHGTRIGLVVASSGRAKRLSPDQIESFRGVAAILGNLVPQKQISEVVRETPQPGQLTRASSETLDACTDPAWLIDPKTKRLLAVNNAASELLGYDEEVLLALRGIAEITVNDSLSPFGVKRGHQNGPLVLTEYQAPSERSLKCSDGTVVLMELTSLPVDLSGNRVILEVARDITQQRLIEDRTRFQTDALNNVNDAVIGIDYNLRITYWNSAAEKMYGWRAPEAVGEKLHDIVSPIWRKADDERVATTAMLTTGHWSGEVSHHHRNGSLISVFSVATAVSGSSVKSDGFYCVNRDITHGKRVESSLAVSQKRYQSLFEANPNAIISFDLSGKITDANAIAESTFGLGSGTSFHANLASIVAPSDLTHVLGCMDRSKMGETVRFEFTGQSSSGNAVQLSCVMLPVTVDGAIDGVYLIARDVGERKRLQAVMIAENSVLQHISSGAPLDDVIARLISSLDEILGDIRTKVTLVSVDEEEFGGAEIGVVEYFRGQFPQNSRLSVGSPVAQVISSKSRVVRVDLPERANDAHRRQSVKAICSSPILDSKGSIFGAFSLLFRQSRPPTMDEISIADRAAALLALAMESNRVTNHLHLTERAMDSTLASVVIFDSSKPERPVIYVNAAFEKNMGYSSASMIGGSLDVLIGEDTDSGIVAKMRASIADELEHQTVIQYRTKDGRALWCSSSLSPVRDQLGKLTYYVEVINDITPMMNAMVSLRGSEERFRQLVENASDIILVIEEEGAIRYASPAIERVMGYSADEVLGSQLIDYIHPEDISRAATVFIHLADKEGTQRSMELRAQRKDGTWCYLEATARNLLKTDGINGVVVNARDLSERMSASDQMDHLAFHDSLTGLPNRTLFNERLSRAIVDARRNETMVAVMFLDVNRFKVINDSLGHSVGDMLLKQVSERLISTARDGDTVARWGGDEFTLIFTNVASTRDGARVAQRIINSLSQPFDVGGTELFTTVSIGISIFPLAGDDVETLVQNADTAMYRAKDEGQSSYQFYSSKMNAGAGERLALEGNLRRALERTEFELFYQPQIDTKSGKIVSAEALVRWRHPELGLVPPKDFIPLAEETGLIVPMGDWIMRAACIQSRLWHDAGYDGFRIAVNLSARQFGQRDLHQTVLRILRETNADPRGLELELTESLLINGESRVVAAMNDLTALGVTVSIDDFGIGYASYAYLKRYPVKALKIDQSFVKGMLTDSHDNAIVQSIISMAHNLKLTVIAEGVETEDQRDALVALECDLLQGYFYGKPMPADEFTKLLVSQG